MSRTYLGAGLLAILLASSAGTGDGQPRQKSVRPIGLVEKEIPGYQIGWFFN